MVKVGGTVTVKIIKIDEKGRIDASIKALLPKPEKLDDGENGGERIVTAVVLIINHATIMRVVKHRKILINQKRKNRQKNDRKSRIASF